MSNENQNSSVDENINLENDNHLDSTQNTTESLKIENEPNLTQNSPLSENLTEHNEDVATSGMETAPFEGQQLSSQTDLQDSDPSHYEEKIQDHLCDVYNKYFEAYQNTYETQLALDETETSEDVLPLSHDEVVQKDGELDQLEDIVVAQIQENILSHNNPSLHEINPLDLNEAIESKVALEEDLNPLSFVKDVLADPQNTQNTGLDDTDYMVRDAMLEMLSKDAQQHVASSHPNMPQVTEQPSVPHGQHTPHHPHIPQSQVTNYNESSALPGSHGMQPAMTQALVPHANALQDADAQTVQALTRWLEKPKEPVRRSYKPFLIAASIFCTLCIGVALGYFIYDNQDRNVAYGISPFGDSSFSNEKETSEITNYIANLKLPNETVYEKRHLNSAQKLSHGALSDHSKNNGAYASMPQSGVSLTTAYSSSLKSGCPHPTIELSALKGGLTKILVASECHKNQMLDIKYGGVIFKRYLDASGRLEFTLDCFAGDQTPIEFSFRDGITLAKAPITKDLDSLVKVAVIWKGAVNFNLHAFEYGAQKGQLGHVWEKNPQSLNRIYQKVQRTGNGHGFLSTMSGGSGQHQKIEVYTFVTKNAQDKHALKFALDYTASQDAFRNHKCVSQDHLRVNYQTVKLIRNRPSQKTQGVALVENCKSGPLRKIDFAYLQQGN